MSPADPIDPIRILVTGAGGPAAIAVLRAYERDASVTMVAADMDPWAAGLYLVPASDRVLVPAGASPHLVDTLIDLCREHRIDVLVPTVDCELEPIALAADRFAAIGVRLLVPPAPVLAVTLDKLALATACTDVVRVPRTESASTTDPDSWEYPVIVKPRRGSGSRGVDVVVSASDLVGRALSEDMMVQELLPGEEYSVDVLADASGRVRAAVPRVRQRVDSGVSVAGYTVVDDELQSFATRVVEALGLPFVSNVQVRRDRLGRPALLEINPRVPGSLALTVAAGVDMARLAVDTLRGRPLANTVPHRAVAMVRYLADHVVELDELMPGAPSHRRPVGPGGHPVGGRLMVAFRIDQDFHVHTTFSDDAVSTPADNVAAAVRAGLATLCLVDHVRKDTTWVPRQVATVRWLDRTAPLDVLVGRRGEDPRRRRAPGPAGLRPPGRPGPHRRPPVPVEVGPGLPVDGGGAAGREGELRAGDVVATLVEATVAAMRRVERPVIAHPFSLLPKLGLDESDVSETLVYHLAVGARSTGALVEVNEKWDCPGPRLAAALDRRGVHLVAGSDSHDCASVGVLPPGQRQARRLVDGGTGVDRELAVTP